MLTNPRDAAAMLGGRIVESGQQAQALQEQTFADPNRPFRVTDPQAMARLTDMLMAGPMGFAPAGITAYHGSPYLFRQFDPTKVGTGEGAQAYGVGAGYTAEARPVAEEYKRLVQADKSGGFPSFLARSRYAESGGDKEKAAASINESIARLENDRNILRNAMDVDETIKSYQDALKVLEDIQSNQGYLYKGDIPDEILPKFLDWDKPLSQQSEEVKKVFNLDKFPDAVYQGKKLADMTGLEIYVATGSRLGEPFSNSPKAAKYLEKKGLRGIRYLDQGSRGTSGQGTSNFIPFSPEDFKVQEINDIPVEDWISKGLL
jgi:hypothetical protein